MNGAQLRGVFVFVIEISINVIAFDFSILNLLEVNHLFICI